jgi:hypothetical protein
MSSELVRDASEDGIAESYRGWTADESTELVNHAHRNAPAFCPVCCFEVVIQAQSNHSEACYRVHCPTCGNACEGSRAGKKPTTLRVRRGEQLTVRILEELRTGPIWVGVADVLPD